MHYFHIPVMGIAYTLETPIKVAHYGISSVMSIADHQLIEKIREYQAHLWGYTFHPIPEAHEKDSRARRITAYLNLVNTIVQERFSRLKDSLFKAGSEINKYFEMLPDQSPLKQAYNYMLSLQGQEQFNAQEALKSKIQPGSIDVNIMTKLDKVNYAKDGSPLPGEYNDAHAALRGFANSDLESAVVFSAGINPRLYSYMANFKAFFPDESGNLKKRIIIKVSDFKSAMVQGKFLAKKGLWVSEFRIESGLNCGGHAFATDGHLLGPILQEFKDRREELFKMLYKSYVQELEKNNQNIPSEESLPARISVQGGVGTHAEQEFLRKEYGVDSVGWGSPFLLVPEAVSIDQPSLELMAQSREKDLYLSKISPLGVPFNTVRNTTEDQTRRNRIAQGKPGSPCNKKYLVSNTEFTEKPACTASNAYQKRKIRELNEQEFENEEQRKQAYEKIVEKTCICNGLTNPALFEKGLSPALKNSGVSICPGPNMAYFSKMVSLKTMVQHINGHLNLVEQRNRPNLFLKELDQYVKYFRNYVESLPLQPSEKTLDYLRTFKANLQSGMDYYKNLFSTPEKRNVINSKGFYEKLENFNFSLERFLTPEKSLSD